MAYSELIKNFERIREYMREFYVYGFRRREEFDQKSGRSYDNERRRIESYLGDYMSFRQNAEGKNVFLSIDSRRTPGNPLYQAWKAKSFTDGDITLHFLLMDVLPKTQPFLTLPEILTRMTTRCQGQMGLDESTVRKRLKEYEELGLVVSGKDGRQRRYGRSLGPSLDGWEDAMAFFAETAPEGVIGSYVLDWMGEQPDWFAFKHHDITRALESGVLGTILDGISRQREVLLREMNRRTKKEQEWRAVPLKIYLSSQNGRSYLIGQDRKYRTIQTWRLDRVTSVSVMGAAGDYAKLQERFYEMREHMWGVRCKPRGGALEHVEFTIHLDEGEEYIYERLLREKRCGTVERLDAHTCRFTADVYDSTEMVPWMRTWICRLEQMNLSNRSVENRFKQDLEEMYRLYGLEEPAPGASAGGA